MVQSSLSMTTSENLVEFGKRSSDPVNRITEGHKVVDSSTRLRVTLRVMIKHFNSLSPFPT